MTVIGITSDHDSSDDEVDFTPTVDIASLPAVVQGRLKALKNLQLKTVQAECQYYKEVHQLDVKFQQQYDEINQKRLTIINGSYEPSGVELEWKDKEEEKDEEVDLEKKVAAIKLDMDENTKGIPKFWMYVMKNANDESLMGLLEDHDEAVLEYLNNITVALNQPKNTGFTLSFHFAENPFFTNSVLTKSYTLREDPDPESPLEFDGPEIISCTGCTIDWKAGKDVTKTTVKVKKLKARKGARCCPDKVAKCCTDKDVTKEVEADSFFSFFSPPKINESGDEDDLDDEERATLAMDFDVGFAIKEKIIPRAVLYFTGEAFDDDDDEFEDLDTEEEGSDED